MLNQLVLGFSKISAQKRRRYEVAPQHKKLFVAASCQERRHQFSLLQRQWVHQPYSSAGFVLRSGWPTQPVTLLLFDEREIILARQGVRWGETKEELGEEK